MKITKRQLKRIIKEVSEETNANAHAKMDMLEALDRGAASVIGRYIMADGVGELVGKNAGHTLDMPQADSIRALEPESRVALFQELKKDLLNRSVVWEALRSVLNQHEWNALMKRVSLQFEAELRKR